MGSWTPDLDAAGAEPGDRVRITGYAVAVEGRLMPTRSAADVDILVVKLDSGYNVGVRRRQGMSLERLAGAPDSTSAAGRAPPSRDGAPVALLGTGGTIASYVDYRTGAVHPAATASELAYATPEVFEVAAVQSEVVFQVFSEDMTASHWLTLAERCAQAFADGAVGVVVPHGTDTMGYTAAALAFMLRDLPGPVVLVGAQRSSDRPSSDAAANLIAASRVAALADLGEVVVLMHAGADDDRLVIHRGVRARKNHSSRRDAFESVNARPLGYVTADRMEMTSRAKPRQPGGPTLLSAWEPDVGLVWSFPGLAADTLRHHVRRGLVVVGTGLGHVPQACIPVLAEAQKAGVPVVIATQCIWGRANLNVYSRGRDEQAAGAIGAHDMLPETAWVKLQHVIGCTDDVETVARLMQTDMVGELSATSAATAKGARP